MFGDTYVIKLYIGNEVQLHDTMYSTSAHNESDVEQIAAQVLCDIVKEEYATDTYFHPEDPAHAALLSNLLSRIQANQSSDYYYELEQINLADSHDQTQWGEYYVALVGDLKDYHVYPTAYPAKMDNESDIEELLKQHILQLAKDSGRYSDLSDADLTNRIERNNLLPFFSDLQTLDLAQ